MTTGLNTGSLVSIKGDINKYQSLVASIKIIFTVLDFSCFVLQAENVSM